MSRNPHRIGQISTAPLMEINSFTSGYTPVVKSSETQILAIHVNKVFSFPHLWITGMLIYVAVINILIFYINSNILIGDILIVMCFIILILFLFFTLNVHFQVESCPLTFMGL